MIGYRLKVECRFLFSWIENAPAAERALEKMAMFSRLFDANGSGKNLMKTWLKKNIQDRLMAVKLTIRALCKDSYIIHAVLPNW